MNTDKTTIQHLYKDGSVSVSLEDMMKWCQKYYDYIPSNQVQATELLELIRKHDHESVFWDYFAQL